MALGAFFSRLKEGLSRSTQKLTDGITTVFKKRRLDEEALEELEELLISADLGPAMEQWVSAQPFPGRAVSRAGRSGALSDAPGGCQHGPAARCGGCDRKA